MTAIPASQNAGRMLDRRLPHFVKPVTAASGTWTSRSSHRLRGSCCMRSRRVGRLPL